MTRVYKHMTREYAEQFRLGWVKISSFVHFHEAEHSVAIHDDLEGVTIGKLGDVVFTTEAAEPMVTTVAGLRFAVSSGGVIDTRNTSYVRHLPPLYLYSTSAESSVGHFEGYDAVVEIADIEHFGRILVDERRDIFEGYYSGWVRYEPRVYDALNHPGLEPDPFVKHSTFEPDGEFRLVFVPSGDVDHRYVVFELEGIRHAFASGLCLIL